MPLHSKVLPRWNNRSCGQSTQHSTTGVPYQENEETISEAIIQEEIAGDFPGLKNTTSHQTESTL